MKIRADHYETIKAAILRDANAPTLPDYLRKGLSPMRWRWDLLRRNVPAAWLCAEVYPYASDAHIDTALRRILREPDEGAPC